MENTAVTVQCQGCKKVQAIVVTNQQMIQEQIKLIKNLHEENNQLKNRNQELNSMNLTLKEQLEKVVVRKVELATQSQQTEESLTKYLQLQKGDEGDDG